MPADHYRCFSIEEEYVLHSDTHASHRTAFHRLLIRLAEGERADTAGSADHRSRPDGSQSSSQTSYIRKSAARAVIVMSSRLFRKEELEGKTVVYSSGWVAGKVKDVVFGLDGTLILVVQKEDGKELRIPMSAILGAADYIVAKDQASGAYAGAGGVPAGSEASTATVCKFCGTTIPPGTVYCPGCGKSQV
jgi:sporulation protein YlmC with PRC-barrel domain